jgi:uncharacterized membrane protein YjjP (DUF1212 family)
MTLSKHQCDLLMKQLLIIGEQMILCGSEIHRVEDTVRRIGKAYGALRTDIFAINSCIFLAMEFPFFDEQTYTRRITHGESTDYQRLEKLNALSRSICWSPISPDELELRVKEIISKKTSTTKFFIGSVLAASAFSLFFGGSYFDAIAAGIVAVLIALMQKYLASYCPTAFFFTFTASLVSGIIIYTTCSFLPFLHSDKVAIGDIMLLVPGIGITTSVRNMLVGDTISGSLRFVEVLLQAAALAAGFMLAMAIAGGDLL